MSSTDDNGSTRAHDPDAGAIKERNLALEGDRVVIRAAGISMPSMSTPSLPRPARMPGAGDYPGHGLDGVLVERWIFKLAMVPPEG